MKRRWRRIDWYSPNQGFFQTNALLLRLLLLLLLPRDSFNDDKYITLIKPVRAKRHNSWCRRALCVSCSSSFSSFLAYFLCCLVACRVLSAPTNTLLVICNKCIQVDDDRICLRNEYLRKYNDVCGWLDGCMDAWMEGTTLNINRVFEITPCSRVYHSHITL